MDEIIVGIGEMKAVTGGWEIVTYALGSCVGICLYDLQAGVGGMVHAMLPTAIRQLDFTNPDKYVDSGIKHLHHDLCYRGAKTENLRAKIVGGAKMFEFNTTARDTDIGNANVLQARQTLAELGIKIKREVTGGTVARTIRFHTIDGRIFIHSANNTEQTI